MSEADQRAALLRQEAVLAIVVNTAMSVGFFFLIFGWTVVSARALALDFLPQSAGITVLGGLVPSLITYRRIASGKVTPAGPVSPKMLQLLRIIAAALIAVAVFGAAAAMLTIWLAPPMIAPLSTLIVKAAYGGMLGGIMIPPLVRSVLGMPILGTQNATPAEAR